MLRCDVVYLVSIAAFLSSLIGTLGPPHSCGHFFRARFEIFHAKFKCDVTAKSVDDCTTRAARDFPIMNIPIGDSDRAEYVFCIGQYGQTAV